MGHFSCAVLVPCISVVLSSCACVCVCEGRGVTCSPFSHFLGIPLNVEVRTRVHNLDGGFMKTTKFIFPVSVLRIYTLDANNTNNDIAIYIGSPFLLSSSMYIILYLLSLCSSMCILKMASLHQTTYSSSSSLVMEPCLLLCSACFLWRFSVSCSNRF